MKIIGHRGARGLAPENTLAALEQALLYAVDEIEIDVRVTKDNQVILCHGSSLPDLSGQRLAIAQTSLSELADAKPDICTLDAALSVIKRRVPLLIEVKPGEPVTPIVAVIHKYMDLGWQPDDFRLASFSQHILRQLHAAVPEVTKIVNAKFSAVHGTYRARQLATKRLNLNNHIVWFGLVRGLARGGYQLTVYNINNQKDMRKAKRWSRLGLYGFITDYPDRAQSFFQGQ